MRRQSITTLCAAGLIFMSGWAAAGDNPAALASGKAASPHARTARHHRSAKPPKAASDGDGTAKASTGAGAVTIGERAVKTGKTLNDNGQKVLPP
jgi:hypothetical protein